MLFISHAVREREREKRGRERKREREKMKDNQLIYKMGLNMLR